MTTKYSDFVLPILTKSVAFNSSEHAFSTDPQVLEIPLLPHPGAFSKIRAHHQHEGIDLYAPIGTSVLSMSKGIVMDVYPFTGAHAGSPWWCDTWAVLVDHGPFLLNYGEISPLVAKGDSLSKGQTLGHIIQVLQKNKGRPQSMLHLEMYALGSSPAKGWGLQEPPPSGLLDPTFLLSSLTTSG
jgi:murein DD-endopeptidase MepM/ murein hydrolase activator NlpD